MQQEDAAKGALAPGKAAEETAQDAAERQEALGDLDALRETEPFGEGER
ncbi:MAG: hypothetical protein HC850_15270 [Rhodomicrobium sp.]|nr:hypothetical protein [Rhodomicrobium sp.]